MTDEERILGATNYPEWLDELMAKLIASGGVIDEDTKTWSGGRIEFYNLKMGDE